MSKLIIKSSVCARRQKVRLHHKIASQILKKKWIRKYFNPNINSNILLY
jgi:hypothetical protein